MPTAPGGSSEIFLEFVGVVLENELIAGATGYRQALRGKCSCCERPRGTLGHHGVAALALDKVK
ncbi:hypothetical protein SF83666_a41630 (plasmid) [Sinorhizobium fredii CCBAU 83666]|nr:hypothetical protein SF83666_a41630 [Sinorhizobium fredii CCBAU 83666]